MQSPFVHILGTNYVPSLAEAYHIRDFITQPLIKLSHLNREIARTQAILDDLTREHDALANHIDAHQALVSPARRLPQELVQEIFICCLPATRNAVMSALEAPVILGRICSAWRRIALSTPRLWSSLHAVIPNRPIRAHEKSSQRSDFLKVWLGRSGARPLSISLVARLNPAVNKTIASQFLECLIPFSRRWKSVEFRVPSKVLNSINTLTKEDVPLLETIKIQDSQSIPTGVQWKNMAILGASHLRNASFPGFGGDPLILPLPWAQLDGLCLESRSWGGGFRMPIELSLRLLRQCPNLTSCTLQITTTFAWPATPVTPLEPVTLSFLRSLYLVETEGVKLSDFFSRLILPELRDLGILGNNRTNPVLPEAHVSFISLLSQPCPLESLDFESGSLSNEALIECLRLTPSLTRLRVIDQNSTPNWSLSGTQEESINQDSLLGLLNPSQQSPCLCPGLEIIELRHCSGLTDRALLSFLQARISNVYPGVARLKRADISFVHDIETDISQEIRPLVEAGLQISLHHSKIPPLGLDSPWEGLGDDRAPLW